MLEARALRCERADRLLFDSLSFSVQPSQIWQIEGANGAGKTSLLRILAGLNPYFEGELFWGSQKLEAAHWLSYWQQMTYLGHNVGVKANLTVLENLTALLALRMQPLKAELTLALEKVSLLEYESQLAGQLSAGQQRRIGLARLFVEKTQLWILDEPFTALDAQGVNFIESCLVAHAQQGGMIIFTTHQSVTLEYPVQRLALSAFCEALTNLPEFL